MLDCDQNTTLDDFGSGILVQDNEDDYFGKKVDGKKAERPTSKSPQSFTPLDSRRIANVVIVKNLNQASSHVQVQALEVGCLMVCSE